MSPTGGASIELSASEMAQLGGAPAPAWPGLKFLYSVSSEQIQGVGRDADYIAGKIAARRGVRRADQSANDSPEEREAQQI